MNEQGEYVIVSADESEQHGEPWFVNQAGDEAWILGSTSTNDPDKALRLSADAARAERDRIVRLDEKLWPPIGPFIARVVGKTAYLMAWDMTDEGRDAARELAEQINGIEFDP